MPPHTHTHTHTHQLPVEGSPSEGALLTQQSAVVLRLSTDADGLNHLGEVDKVHELHCFVHAGVRGCGCVIVGYVDVWVCVQEGECESPYRALVPHAKNPLIHKDVSARASLAIVVLQACRIFLAFSLHTHA